jgi:hypothetical protein
MDDRGMDEWERAGRLAYSALMEAPPEEATPDKLIDEANAVEDALGDCTLCRAVDCIAELRKKHAAEVERLTEALCGAIAFMEAVNVGEGDYPQWREQYDDARRAVGIETAGE